MDQNDKQNTSSQTPGGDLPPLSETGVDVKAPEKASEKVPTDSGLPVKPKVVKPEPASAPVLPDSGGLPPLETAEDETFNPKVVNEEKKEEKIKKVDEVGEKTLPPLPAVDTDQTSEGLKEVKEMGEINSENQEIPPPPPPKETPVAPGKMEDKPLATKGIDMGDDGGKGKKKGKKKISKKTIVGGLIALVLLIGVPVLALNLDYFRGDVRERASTCRDTGCLYPGERCCSGSSEEYDGRCSVTETKCVVNPTPTLTRIQTPNPTATSTPTPPTSTPAPECRESGDCLYPGERCCSGLVEWYDYGCAVTETRCAVNNPLPTKTPTPWEPPEGCIGENECLQPGMLCCPGLSMKFTKPTDEKYCHVTETKCVRGDVTPIPTKKPTVTVTPTKKPTVTVTPTKKPTVTVTPTKKPTVGICVAIKIYTLQESVWVETPVAEVGQHASVGDTIRLALKGNSSAFVRGRFRVVGGVSGSTDGVTGSWIETSKKNGNGELYLDYLLENGGSYSVEGEIRK